MAGLSDSLNNSLEDSLEKAVTQSDDAAHKTLERLLVSELGPPPHKVKVRMLHRSTCCSLKCSLSHWEQLLLKAFAKTSA